MSQGSLKNNWWTYLWLKSEKPLIIFIVFNILISSVTGYLTPIFIQGFYDSLNDNVRFFQELYLLLGLFIVEYLNRFCFSVSTNKYVQLLLIEVRRQSYDRWLKASFQ